MITLRKATLEDSLHLYVWRNHPSTRAMMRSTDEIPWESHRRWLRDTLEDTQRHLLIGVRDGQSVGSVRFDVDGDEAEISVMVAPDCRGGGIGTELIRLGTAWMFINTTVHTVQAYVKASNTASDSAFRKAGYSAVSHTEDGVILVDSRTPLA